MGNTSSMCVVAITAATGTKAFPSTQQKILPASRSRCGRFHLPAATPKRSAKVRSPPYRHAETGLRLRGTTRSGSVRSTAPCLQKNSSTFAETSGVWRGRRTGQGSHLSLTVAITPGLAFSPMIPLHSSGLLQPAGETSRHVGRLMGSESLLYDRREEVAFRTPFSSSAIYRGRSGPPTQRRAPASCCGKPREHCAALTRRPKGKRIFIGQQMIG